MVVRLYGFERRRNVRRSWRVLWRLIQRMSALVYWRMFMSMSVHRMVFVMNTMHVRVMMLVLYLHLLSGYFFLFLLFSQVVF
jgi:hypothetical protein